MTKIIVYTRPDGGLSVCRPALNARLCVVGEKDATTVVPFYAAQREADLLALPYDEAVAALSPRWAETEDEFVARVRELSVPADADGVRIADESELPGGGSMVK